MASSVFNQNSNIYKVKNFARNVPVTIASGVGKNISVGAAPK